MVAAPVEKPVVWVGSSKRDLKEFPDEVQDVLGGAPQTVQWGRTPAIAKPLKGYGGATVMEIVDDYNSDTYRAVYAVRFKGVVFVLHCFQKKSKRGRETPRRDKELIGSRLREAARIYSDLRERGEVE